MNIMALISALPGAAAQGLIWGIMAIGVYITFRTLDIADLPPASLPIRCVHSSSS